MLGAAMLPTRTSNETQSFAHVPPFPVRQHSSNNGADWPVEAAMHPTRCYYSNAPHELEAGRSSYSHSSRLEAGDPAIIAAARSTRSTGASAALPARVLAVGPGGRGRNWIREQIRSRAGAGIMTQDGFCGGSNLQARRDHSSYRRPDGGPAVRQSS